jgi:hypothetical protein
MLSMSDSPIHLRDLCMLNAVSEHGPLYYSFIHPFIGLINGFSVEEKTENKKIIRCFC